MSCQQHRVSAAAGRRARGGRLDAWRRLRWVRYRMLRKCVRCARQGEKGVRRTSSMSLALPDDGVARCRSEVDGWMDGSWSLDGGRSKHE